MSNADTLHLLTIKEAAEMLHSSVTVSSLHNARREGQLWARRIGKMYYTTKPAIEEFLQCPAPENLPDSTSEKTKNNGSSVTATRNIGQGLALASLKRLKMNSLNTSKIENRPTAEVQPIRGN